MERKPELSLFVGGMYLQQQAELRIVSRRISPLGIF